MYRPVCLFLVMLPTAAIAVAAYPGEMSAAQQSPAAFARTYAAGQHSIAVRDSAAGAAMVTTTTPSAPPGYLLQPGDLLSVTVWKEQDLTGDVLVRPDGGMSFPLAGDLEAMGKTVSQVQAEITGRLLKYIPSPVVTVEVKQVGGNHIYVVGKVQRPGEYPMVRPVDVMQALSLAGGTTPYASLNGIVILHRENGVQKAIHFRYSDVARGRDLSQNILLQSGDTVVVP